MGLAGGPAMLNRVMKATYPVAVTYSRKVDGVTYSVVGLTGWLGNTLFSGLTESAVAVQWGQVDVLLAAADLVLGGQPTAPTAGDRLVMTVGGVSGTWEVKGPETGEPAWRWSDHTRTRFRIHLNRVN